MGHAHGAEDVVVDRVNDASEEATVVVEETARGLAVESPSE